MSRSLDIKPVLGHVKEEWRAKISEKRSFLSLEEETVLPPTQIQKFSNSAAVYLLLFLTDLIFLIKM